MLRSSDGAAGTCGFCAMRGAEIWCASNSARANRQRPARFWCSGISTPFIPIGTLRRMPFRVAQGRAWGPGTFDMKGGIVLALFAVEALRALRITPRRKIVFLWTGDEEIGSEASRAMIEKEARRSKAVLVLEPALGLDGLREDAAERDWRSRNYRARAGGSCGRRSGARSECGARTGAADCALDEDERSAAWNYRAGERDCRRDGDERGAGNCARAGGCAIRAGARCARA